LVLSAVVFLVALFLIKNKSLFTNIANYTSQSANQGGLAYNKAIIEDLVARDLDKDGVLDWEESLWGTDPTKKDTNGDGMPDNVEIENLKKQKEQNGQDEQGESLLTAENGENLTETDKFSRELFATIAALNQSGAMDQATIDQLSSSLAERIQNSPPRKVFSLADLKIIKNETLIDVKNYNSAFDSLSAKYPVNYNVYDVLQKFVVDENSVDTTALSELDPIIIQVNKIIADMARMNVPTSFSSLHLDLINALQRLLENVSDIKLYDTDPIVALSGMSQYDSNTVALETAISNLGIAVQKKLSN
jgi:hypothetical protein